jgi:hypothetical protein
MERKKSAPNNQKSSKLKKVNRIRRTAAETRV